MIYPEIIMPDTTEKRKLLFVILNKPERLQDLMVIFVELGLKGATVFDSVGMGKILTQDVPLFAELRGFLTGARQQNKTIMILLPEEMIPLVVEAFEEAVGPLSEPGNGVIFAVPVEQIYGAQ
jgi:nitrogen regulatory protein PII